MAKHTFIFRISWFLQILTGVALISLLISFQSHAQPPDDWGPVSIGLEEIEYPHPVSYMSFSVQGKDVRMAYMDVPPVGAANGQTVVLLHGLNFFGEYYYHSSGPGKYDRETRLSAIQNMAKYR